VEHYRIPQRKLNRNSERANGETGESGDKCDLPSFPERVRQERHGMRSPEEEQLTVGADEPPDERQELGVNP
jgi:hypothetical protein